MSCRNFETIITELARGQMVEARAKEEALAHAESCKRCAALKASEQALTTGLRAVAASAASAETPAHVEAALLNAFRQRSAQPSVPAVVPVPANPARWMRWSIAAAAVLLVVAALASLRLLSTDSSGEAKRETLVAQPTPLSSPEQIVGKLAHDDNEIAPMPAADNRGQRAVAFSRQPTGRRRNLGLTNAGIRNAGNVETATNANEEIATDFLPLTYDNNLSQLDDGQVVRVELSRSALHSFGLPVNLERGSERVKADVLLGHDGVARAIRFVR